MVKPSTWPYKSLDAAVASQKKMAKFTAVVCWAGAFLIILAIWLSLWAQYALPGAGIPAPTLPQAIFLTAVNLAIALAADAWARRGPEAFRWRFLQLQEREAMKQAQRE